MITHHSAEIRVRRYDGVPQCDVVVSFRGHAMTLRCRNYDQAVDWARIEFNKKNPPLATGRQFGRNAGNVLRIELALCVLPATGFVFLSVEQT